MVKFNPQREVRCVFKVPTKGSKEMGFAVRGPLFFLIFQCEDVRKQVDTRSSGDLTSPVDRLLIFPQDRKLTGVLWRGHYFSRYVL